MNLIGWILVRNDEKVKTGGGIYSGGSNSKVYKTEKIAQSALNKSSIIDKDNVDVVPVYYEIKQKDVLSVKMQENDADALTIGEYLKDLLMGIVIEKESFSGKRPFGNSGWQYELYEALARSGISNAVVDDSGEIVDHDGDNCDKLLISAIEKVFNYK